VNFLYEKRKIFGLPGTALTPRVGLMFVADDLQR